MVFENYEKTVTFDYDLVRDTVEGVASEMLKELQIDPSYQEVIAEKINQIVLPEKEKHRKEISDQSAIETQFGKVIETFNNFLNMMGKTGH